MSAWRFMRSKPVGPNSDVVHWRICVRTDGRLAEEIMWHDVSQAGVKVVFCKRQGLEWVAEQLLASEEKLFSIILIIIHCSDFGSYNVENEQNSYSITSFDEGVCCSFSWQRGHFNIMLVLQSCTDSLQVLPGSFLKHYQHHLMVHMTLVIWSLTWI